MKKTLSIIALLLLGYFIYFFVGYTKKTPQSVLDSFPKTPIDKSKSAQFISDATPKRKVVLSGNNWEGTITIFDPSTFEVIKTISAVPDLQERMDEIYAGGKRKVMVSMIRNIIGEGHDQMVDDMFTSNDGKYIFVSRPSFSDVIALDVNSGEIFWRCPVEGFRSDHSAISPDGKVFLVSASTAKKVLAIDTQTGKVINSFPTGDQPHENIYSADGNRIYHASVGKIFIKPPFLDFVKGDRFFQIVDAKTYKVLRQIDLKPRLKAAGYDFKDHSIRPMAITPDEKFAYFQISLFHGIVEYDIENDKITRKLDLPIPEAVKNVTINNSAHHGLSIDGSGEILCAAGTVSGYVALIDRKTFAFDTIRLTENPLGSKPYWVTASADGTQFYVSQSERDLVSVIDPKAKKIIANIPVGDHPQRVRSGELRLQ
ncbi:MAG: serine/threonine protein kinase [Flavobacteriaceae bacterium]|nr:MAG: serine/threonine protein kinase [Flavobacteriaceae bacterium]